MTRTQSSIVSQQKTEGPHFARITSFFFRHFFNAVIDNPPPDTHSTSAKLAELSRLPSIYESLAAPSDLPLG